MKAALIKQKSRRSEMGGGGGGNDDGDDAASPRALKVLWLSALATAGAVYPAMYCLIIRQDRYEKAAKEAAERAERGDADTAATGATYDDRMAGGGRRRLPKSRYASISCYIADCNARRATKRAGGEDGVARAMSDESDCGGCSDQSKNAKRDAEFNDIEAPYDEAAYAQLVAGGVDGTVRLFDTRAYATAAELTAKPAAAAPSKPAARRGGRRAAAAE